MLKTVKSWRKCAGKGIRLDSEPRMHYNETKKSLYTDNPERSEGRIAPYGAPDMTKRVLKLLVPVVLLLGLTLLAGVALASEAPIDVQMEITPTTLNAPGTVNVGISIINSSEGAMPVSVTLYDPNSAVVSGFGSGGTTSIEQGKFATWSGSWTVTQAQLDAGRVTYVVAYRMNDENGNQVSVRKPVSARITYQDAKPALTISRSCPSSALEGQTVDITCTITNTGTIAAENVTVVDANITKESPSHPLLNPGETVELKYSFVMGNKPMTTEAVVSYAYTIGDRINNRKSTLAAKQISVATVGMIVELDAATRIVNAGDKFDLVCKLINKGDLTYNQLRVTDPTLGDLDSGLTLRANETHEFTVSRTMLQSGTYRFTVSGVDETGAAVSFTSNDVTIQIPAGGASTDVTTDSVIPVILDIVIEADRSIIYAEPSEIIFHIKITNNGTTAVENAVLSAMRRGGARTTVKTIDSIAPGETYDLVKQFRASVGGQFQFGVVAKDNTGEDNEFLSNIYQVTFQATKPPVTPPPPPSAPPADPTAPTEQIVTPFDDGEEETGLSTGSLLLYILAGLLAIILIAFLLLFFLDRRRNRPASRAGAAPAIDHMQRSSPRDYARAPKRGNNRQRSAVPERMNAYGEDDDSLIEEPPENLPPPPSRPMRIHDVEPAPAADRAPEPSPAIFGEEETKKPDLAETQVYNSDYLGKFRKSESANAEKSKEDASMLSGSTGQYKLTGRSASIRRRATTPVQAEEPESFSRRQRAERAQKKPENDFFSDDDDL